MLKLATSHMIPPRSVPLSAFILPITVAVPGRTVLSRMSVLANDTAFVVISLCWDIVRRDLTVSNRMSGNVLISQRRVLVTTRDASFLMLSGLTGIARRLLVLRRLQLSHRSTLVEREIILNLLLLNLTLRLVLVALLCPSIRCRLRMRRWGMNSSH